MAIWAFVRCAIQMKICCASPLTQVLGSPNATEWQAMNPKWHRTVGNRVIQDEGISSFKRPPKRQLPHIPPRPLSDVVLRSVNKKLNPECVKAVEFLEKMLVVLVGLVRSVEVCVEVHSAIFVSREIYSYMLSVLSDAQDQGAGQEDQCDRGRVLE